MEKSPVIYRLPKLPYSVQSFGEFLSRESFSYHYEKHHQAYLDELNKLVHGTPHENESLEEILRSSSWGEAKLFNQAGQAWNHAFYWHSMTPDRTEPTGKLRELIENSFESVENFARQWVDRGVARFASGWVWLVVNEEEKLSVITTSNAENPLLFRQKPLICADVWEHAYYIDHRNDRKRFLTQWVSHIDWRFAAANLASPGFPRMGETMRGSGA